MHSVIVEKTFSLAYFQLFFKLFSFVLNIILTRFLPRDILGLVNVRLLLLYTSIVFITREPFRKVCMSFDMKKNFYKSLSLIWLVVPFGLILCFIFKLIWFYFVSIPEKYPEYNIVVYMYIMAAFIELLSEPFWIISQINLMIKTRVIIESSALLCRIIISTLLFFYFPNLGLLIFGFAQISYSFFILFSYIFYFYWLIQNKDKYPELQNYNVNYLQDFIPNLKIIPFDINSLKMIKSFIFNCTLKQLLTEGERYIMTWTNLISLEMQGQFDFVNNLGSLAPRLIFSAIEDSCHLTFAKLMKQNLNAIKQDESQLKLAIKVFYTSQKVVLLLGLSIFIFAQAYSLPLLAFCGGLDKANETSVLLMRIFALYVVLLAVNGVTESFYYSIVSREELNRHSYRMIGFSVVFLLSCLGFIYYWGVIGIIFANCINMSLRICVSFNFLQHFFKGSTYNLKELLKNCLPNIKVLLSYLITFIIIMLSKNHFKEDLISQMIHVSVGGVFIIFITIVVFLTEPDFLQFLLTKFKKSKIQ